MPELVERLGAGDGDGTVGGVERVFLITDVRGYSSFTTERGDAEAARLASRFAELVGDAVAARNGRVVEVRGDEVFAIFESAAQAVRAATELTAVCADEAAAEAGLPLFPGLGIDIGEGVPVDGGFRGAALNMAARLCSKAGGGQVLVTTRLAECAGPIAGVEFRPAGAAELKGFAGPVELVEAVADQQPRLPRADGPSARLPFELEIDSPLAGRERELAWLRGTWRQVARGRGRVLVVSGPSGMGKTRVAAELAAFAGSSGAVVVYAGAGGTAAAVGGAGLRSSLESSAPALLVLDDFDATAEVLAPQLAAALAEIENGPTLVLCLLHNVDLGPEVQELLSAVDGRGDGLRGLGPLESDAIRTIAGLYAKGDVDSVPLESIARASGGVPAQVHELMSAWAQQEATRRLAAAAEFLAAERRHRSADLAFANNAIGLKLGRLYSGEASVELEQGEAPYKGLASFEESDAALFFGREQLVGELAARTVGSGLLAVVGASGSGKSSLIAAGLLPSLQLGLLPGSERWRSVAMRPGEHPLGELLLATVTDDDRGERLVVAIDQFEELFTLCGGEEERAAFVDRLVGLAEDPGRYVVVLGLRGDFYGHCGGYPDLARLVAANQVLVGPMGADELRRAIELPARRTGVRVESALTDALVEEIADEPGGLPLLSTALVELWQERDDDWLRVSTYQRLGGVRGAVARLAESSYENLTDEQRDAARRLFLRLVASGEEGVLTRRRVPLRELDLDRDPALAGVVERLTSDRLLTAHEASVEVAHEALLREWPRFRDWLAEDAQGRELREHLTESAKRWDGAGRDSAELYRGARLSATIDWAAGRERELNELEREFLTASRSHADLEADRQRRQNRRLRGLLVGAAVLLVAAIVGGIVALQQRSSAQHQATVALGRQLGAEAVSQPRIDRSMLLARESLNLDRSPQTEGTLLATLLRSPAAIGTFALPISAGRPQEVKVSPDGRSIAAVTNCCGMKIFDTRTHQLVRTIPLANGDYAYVPTTGDLFAPAPGGFNPSYFLVDPHSGRTLRTFTLSKLWVNSPVVDQPVAVTQDGRYAFAPWSTTKQNGSNGPGYIEAWRLDRGGESTLVPTGVDGLVVAAQALTGDRLMIAQSGRITTWDAATRRRLASVPGPRFTGHFAPVALSPNGRTLAYGLDGIVRFFDIASGKTIVGEGAHSAQVNRMTFSPDSRVAVSTGDDGLAIVWDPRTGTVLQRLTGHANTRVFAADFSPDSKTLYTPGIDGAILQYDLGTNRRFGSPFSVGVGLPRGGTIMVPPLLAASPDGRTLAASVEQSAVNFFSTSTLRRVARISLAPTRNVFQGAWVGNGRFVVGADQGLVQVWAVGSRPRRVAVLPGLSKERTVQSVASGEGGHLIAAVDAATAPEHGPPPPPQGELGLWRDGKLVGGHTLDLHTNGRWVAISPDGRQAAVSPDDGSVLIVDTRTGHVERSIRPPDSNPGDMIGVVAFSPDGILATGSFSGAVSLWNPATGKMIGHSTVVADGPVAGIAFAPDGKTFATSGFGGATRIWQTSTQQQFGTDFPSSKGLWGNVDYTPDGRSLFYAYGDGSAYRFPVTLQAWERHACGVAGRNFTTEEWHRFVGSRSYSTICR